MVITRESNDGDFASAVSLLHHDQASCWLELNGGVSLMLSKNRTRFVIAVLIVAVAGSLGGCKENKPAPEESSVTSAPGPILNKHLYSETADAQADIAAALQRARAENKRVILDFGGNWCVDCQVLDIYMHQIPNAELLAKNFVVVHVDIGHMDHNVDVAERYNIPLKKGVPALAVLDADGKLLYAQQNREFEKMRNVQPGDVTDFLNRWKA
jgi:thiol:disulfide interchange protein